MTKIIFSLFTLLLLYPSYAEDISIEKPYVREVPPGQMNSASFLTINNTSEKDIALIKASSDVAKNVELHEHVHDAGMMKMRQVNQINIEAKGTTVLKPGGYHVMLIGLTRKIKSGDIIDLTLEFDNGEKKSVHAEVKKIMQGMMKKGAMKKMKGMSKSNNTDL